MCNTPAKCFIPMFNVNGVKRSKLHKYLMRKRPEEKIFNEIQSGPACIYQRTKNGHSSLFLALSNNIENVVRKLMTIYENDFKVLKEYGFTKESAVLIAFGPTDIAFVDEKLEKISSENESEAKSKILILMKETNESPAQVKLLTASHDEEQKTCLEIIERLHPNGTFDAIDVPNNNGETLFLVAAAQGYIWVLEKLLEFGSSHDIANKQKHTPFEAACDSNQLETIKWFHKKFKVDLLNYMTEGETLFNFATRGNFDVFDYIMSEIKRFDGDEHVAEIFARRMEYHESNILMHAINYGQSSFALKCLKYEPDLEAIDSSSNNVLHTALRSCSWQLYEELCRKLIKSHPHLLSMVDSNQWTPLHLLATKNFLAEFKQIYTQHPSYKTVFFKHFADSPTVEKKLNEIWCSSPGHEALRNVVQEGYFEMAEFIIEQHPDEIDSAAYISSLLIALADREESSIGFIEKLQKLKNFDVNVPDENNSYPIYNALSRRNYEMFNYLLKSCSVRDFNVMLEPYVKSNLLWEAIWRKPLEITAMPYGVCCFPPDKDSSGEEEASRPNDDEPLECYEPDDAPTQPPQKDAARKVLFDIFMDLLKRGVDPKLVHAQKENLLHAAVSSDNIEVVQELLNLGLSIDQANEQENIPLHHVRSLEVLQALVRHESYKPEHINLKNATGWTPFMFFASNYGREVVNVELFDEFIKQGSDVNTTAAEGYRPIHAVKTEEWVKLLVKHGADITATTSNGENAVHHALRDQKWSLAKFLLHQKEIDRFAVTNDDVSYLGYFSMGNVEYQKVFSDLHFNELLDKFINGKNLYGGVIINTFLCHSDMKYIKHPKADLHQTEADGATCLHQSICCNADLAVIEYLIEQGLDINAVNENGFTPLIFSLDLNKTKIASFLIDQNNIDLNQVNAYGFNALHYAARNEDISNVCKLLAAGADPSVVNNENESFYDLLTESDKKLFSFYEAKR